MASALNVVPDSVNSATDPAGLAVAALCNGIASKVQCARALARVACPSCDVLGELPNEAVDALKRRLTAWFAAFAVLARSPSQTAAAVGSAAVQSAGRGLQSNGSASGAVPGSHEPGADYASGSGGTVIIVIMVSIIALVSLFAGGVVYLYVLRPLNDRRTRAGSGARATPTGSAGEPGIDAEAAAIEDSIISSTRLGVAPDRRSSSSGADGRSAGGRRQALHVHRNSSASRSTMGGRLGLGVGAHEVEVSSARSDRDPECDAADSASAACDNDDPTGPPVPGGSLAHSASAASSAGPQQLAQADACHVRAAAHAHNNSRQRSSPLARAPGTRLFATLQAYASYPITSPRNQTLGRAVQGPSRLGLQPDSGQAAAASTGAGSYLSGTVAVSRLHIGPRGSGAARSPLHMHSGAARMPVGAADGDTAVTAAHQVDCCDVDDTFPTAPTPNCSGATLPCALAGQPVGQASIRVGAAIVETAPSPRHVQAAADADATATVALETCQLDLPPCRIAPAGEATAHGTRSARTVTLELVSVATPAAELEAAEVAAAEIRAAESAAMDAACSASGRSTERAVAVAAVACEA